MIDENIRAQPPAREDAQPVARVSPDDMAQMTCFANNHGTVEDWHVWCRIRSALTTHPAPDALRVAVEALEKIKAGVVEVFDDELQCNVEVTMDGEEASDIASQALAALQHEGR